MNPTILWSLAGIFGILIIATLILFILKKINPERSYKELKQRISSWWIMASVFSVALLLNKHISLAFFAFISFLAFKEFLSIIPVRRADRRVLFWAYLAIPIQYYWVADQWYGMFIIFIPVYMFLFLPLRMVLIGETKDFLRSVGTVHWGMMTMIFSLSHLAFLLVLPQSGNPAAGGAGLVLFLVFLTQFNDVSQFLWGKALGKSKVLPSVSPNKTNAGFYGGVFTTTLLALGLAPILTPFTLVQSLCAGLIISIGGFIGDVTISAVKRDIGIKDCGNLLPGHGGILDRIDSLIVTAPLFFHFVRYLHY